MYINKIKGVSYMRSREHVGYRTKMRGTINVNRYESPLDLMTRLKGMYYRIIEWFQLERT